VTELVRLHPDEREAIAHRVAELLRDEVVACSGPEPAHLLTAAEVAKRFGVSREWVYEHKARLGAVALGDGRRPRLRFDPVRVAEALDKGAATSAPAQADAATVDASRRRRRGPRATRSDPPLLPYEGFEA